MLNTQTLDGLSSSMASSKSYFSMPHTNSHITQSIEPKEFSIYRPDVDFSINYEPVGDKLRLVDDAKDSVPKQNIMDNGRKAVVINCDLTNLHNYSKTVPDMESDKNNNNKDPAAGQPDDDDSGNNNNNNKMDDPGKRPEHHVRRPMNAFLIYCKRHRAIVREHFPTNENRSITKILGEWWAYVENNDKTPYRKLAKDYKDVFFSKNPNFKWYKLPAPPLRTLSTRPGNDRSTVVSPTLMNGDELTESASKDRAARNGKPQQQNMNFGQFKMASIDQMGGLTSLMTMDSGPVRVNGAIFGDNVSKELRTALNDVTIAGHSVGLKRKVDDDVEIVHDELLNGKSHRACKGKRYEQFMTPSRKTKKQSTNTSTTTMSSSTAPFPHNGYQKPQQEHEPLKHEVSSDELSVIAASPESDEACEARNADAADFDLEQKIMALPCLDFDAYLKRKKAAKKKKKFTHKAKRLQKAQAIPKPIPKPAGSQKRKAPKQSIRRAPKVIQAQQIQDMIGLETLATVALVQAEGNTQ